MGDHGHHNRIAGPAFLDKTFDRHPRVAQSGRDFGQNARAIGHHEADIGAAQAVAGLPGLRLRGLMCIPEPAPDFEGQRAVFLQARALFDDLRARGMALDTLSMGMSDDLEAAVSAGSTLVRVGRATFGHRERKPGPADAVTTAAG